MQISWFEIVAQIINFFIILFILQKLLYKPVIKAMAERQVSIQKSQKEADEKMDNAKELISEYKNKMAEAENEKSSIINQARIEAKEKKDSLLEDYKIEADRKRSSYLKEIQDEKSNFIDNLRKTMGESAVKIASHILEMISSKELEEEVFKSFIEVLNNLEDNIEDKRTLEDERQTELYSARELSDSEKETIKKALKTSLKNLETIEFNVDPDLILGYELNLETYTVHTSIKNYLDGVEADILKMLEKDD
ncbi:MAG: F0F1 ATP synthase subunit delta [Gudongella sp.]|nr:F0F1 ATP synthase subunit delta [Gudongella sp.]